MDRFKLVQICPGKYGIIDEEDHRATLSVHGEPVRYTLSQKESSSELVDMLNRLHRRAEDAEEIAPLDFDQPARDSNGILGYD